MEIPLADENDLGRLIDYMLLAYHEARNVRHLPATEIDKSAHQRVITLDKDKFETWAQLQTLRREAKVAREFNLSVRVIERRFRLSLEDLVAVYGNPHGRGSGRGGNKWAGISTQLLDARNAALEGDSDTVNRLVVQIGTTCHNTGFVAEKLQLLDEHLGVDQP